MTYTEKMTNTPLRPELEALPERMRELPIDKRGYPVPWFVAWNNGEPEFRAMDGEKWRTAIKYRRCWVCGGGLGAHLVFTIGPMCGINRTTAEPPSHLECARWSARNCPFLTQREIKRREDDDINAKCPVAGISIRRNPGVALLWITRKYHLFPDGKGMYLIRIGEPDSLEWFSHGRIATRAEIEASVESGFPILMDMAIKHGGVDELLEQKKRFEALYPPA